MWGENKILREITTAATRKIINATAGGKQFLEPAMVIEPAMVEMIKNLESTK